MRDTIEAGPHAGEDGALELLVWLSPAFPVGSFAYSQGLEWAVAAGAVHDLHSLQDWLTDVLNCGSIRTDQLLLSLVYRAQSAEETRRLAELAYALQPSRERAEETSMQGGAFLAATEAGWLDAGWHGAELEAGSPVALPVAVGLAARRRGLPLQPTLAAFALAALTGQTSAAIRLGVVGQFDGQRVLAALIADLRRQSVWAATAQVDEIGGATFAADLASIRHEQLGTRLFRS